VSNGGDDDQPVSDNAARLAESVRVARSKPAPAPARSTAPSTTPPESPNTVRFPHPDAPAPTSSANPENFAPPEVESVDQGQDQGSVSATSSPGKLSTPTPPLSAHPESFAPPEASAVEVEPETTTHKHAVDEGDLTEGDKEVTHVEAPDFVLITAEDLDYATPVESQPRFADLGRILTIIPTYNERGNVERIISRVRAALPEVHVLVADDNSPDGTGKVADLIADQDDHVHVLHRLGKEGLGAAYLAGFQWALDNGYDVMVEMDADGSHRPEQLDLLLDGLRESDLVLGSRWIEGGSVVNWPKSREFLSRGGNWYTRKALGMPLRDATGGYRAFRATTLRTLDLDGVGSAGYIFQVDLAYRVIQAGLKVTEVPIEFHEREIGDSKMNGSIVSEALWMVTVWGFRERMRKAGRRRIKNTKAKNKQGW